MSSKTEHQLPWYLDAIVYCVDLARFRDSDANGYGDFNGLISKLGYLEWLGVDAIWLLPFYRSPRHDNGYDVTDHYDIDERLGDTGDFVRLLREAEHRSIHVMIDLVINHTSIHHRWFEESRDPAHPRRDWYVWADDLDQVPEYQPVFPPVQRSTWRWDDRGQGWYLHHFHDFEPDLNTQNEHFQAEVRNMVEYWIRLGVRGFRVDGAPFFGLKRRRDEAAVHHLLRNIHDWARDIHEQTVLLPEANLDAEALEPYVHDGNAQMLFNFLGSQHLFLAMATEEAEPLRKIVEVMPRGSDTFQWLTFLRNHDELSLDRLTPDERQRVLDTFSPDPDSHIYDRGSRRRLAPLLGGDRRRMELAFSLLFAMPGTPMFVAGDEIGMGENLDLPRREAARLPMQWSGSMPNGGFSEADPGNLVTPVLTDGPFGIPRVNVEDEQGNPESFLHWVRHLIRTRREANRYVLKTRPELSVPAPPVLVMTYRPDDTDAAVLVHNLSGSEVRVEVENLPGNEPRLASPGVARRGTTLRLGPFGYAWWLPAAGSGKESAPV